MNNNAEVKLAVNRRDFLKMSGGLLLGSSLAGLTLLNSPPAYANDVIQNAFWRQNRWLHLQRQGQSGTLELCFFKDGQYDKTAYQRLCWLMRDVKDANTAVAVDIGVFNLLYGIQEWARMLRYEKPIITINSGYRTQRHNNSIEGAAKHSLHMQARAVDYSMNGVPLSLLRDMARYYAVGGVGEYPTFLHIDTGRVRHWKGK